MGCYRTNINNSKNWSMVDMISINQNSGTEHSCVNNEENHDDEYNEENDDGTDLPHIWVYHYNYHWF